MDSNHKMLLAAAVLIIVMGATYYLQKKSPLPPSPTPTSPQQIIVQLKPQNAASIDGNALLSEVNGKVTVKLQLGGSPAYNTSPAHIHAGSCPTPGEVKYPLTPVNSVGFSETTLEVSLDQLKSQAPLAMNVHESAQNLSTYLSCGNLAF